MKRSITVNICTDNMIVNVNRIQDMFLISAMNASPCEETSIFMFLKEIKT